MDTLIYVCGIVWTFERKDWFNISDRFPINYEEEKTCFTPEMVYENTGLQSHIMNMKQI